LTLFFTGCLVVSQGGEHSAIRPEVAAALIPHPLHDVAIILRVAGGVLVASLTSFPAWPLIAALLLTGTWSSPHFATAFVLLALTEVVTVAIGRAPLVRAGFPEAHLVQSTRYYYGPQAFLAVVAGLGLAAVPARARRFLALATPLTLAAFVFWEPTIPPPSEQATVTRALADGIKPDADGIADNAPFGPIEGLQLLFVPRRLFPGLAGAFTVFGDGTNVRFRARDFGEYEAVRRGGRIAQILLPPVGKLR
jgi:hypothetical protein